ncbi:MAG TPA: 4-demethylwyosine synthase TYW1 [Candidatus Woesearchaeota archaeon]|nr:4-demethylwyosine synthase TYW1 [Candidatus Woesearchaeota archaeon]
MQDKAQVRKTLKKQQYGFSGGHTAVKICTWTKRSLLNRDVCYKQVFYGIQAHLCCQMSPSVNYCQNSCIFCWRSFADTKGFDEIPRDLADKPEAIIEKSFSQQRKLLSGFGGNEKVSLEKLKQAQNPKHFAISLTGEPTLYPFLPELIEALHKRGITTFVVTNGLNPGMLKKIFPTQLYQSVSAPDEKTFLEIEKPKIKSAWNLFNESLGVMSEKRNSKTRTCLRITLIKGINDFAPERYAQLIKSANPLFVEVKSYMHVGSSIYRLEKTNMPLHNDIKEFAGKISAFCEWKPADEKKESRVVLLMKPEDHGKRFLKDFSNISV